jgi:histone arginine demethylase JMJD6
MCHNLTSIDIVATDFINPEIFREKYSYTGRPLIVRNATNQWPAVDTFTFEFFRKLYEDLDRLVYHQINGK